MWFIGVEVEQETSAPPPKKNPGSAPEHAAVKQPFCSAFLPHVSSYTQKESEISAGEGGQKSS